MSGPEESKDASLALAPQDSVLLDDKDKANTDKQGDVEMADEGNVNQVPELQKQKSVFNESDVITVNFKGRIREIMKYQGADGTQKIKEKLVDSFATIMVGVIGYKEVYEAWENEYKSVIDDFREEGTSNITQANSSNWLEQIPQVLCLQLNRLEYDEKHKEQVKSRHKVEIEKTLYIDRFMMNNKEKSEQISNKVKSLRE